MAKSKYSCRIRKKTSPKSNHSTNKPAEKKKIDVENIKYPCVTTMMWEQLEKEKFKGFRVFTRGIWHALLIFSIFGLLISGREVLYSPIRFGVTTIFAVMLIKGLFIDDYPDPTETPVLKNLRFATSLIIFPTMYYIPFNYPTMDVLVTSFSILAGGFSIYHLSSTMDIGHGILILLLAFTNGNFAIMFTALDGDCPLGAGLFTSLVFQYIIYGYNFDFLATVV